MLKVLAVIDNFLPPFVERTGLRVLAALFRRLLSQGCELHVLTTVSRHADPAWRAWVDDQRCRGLRIHARREPFAQWPRLGFLSARVSLAAEVWRLQRACNFDIIHEYSSAPILANRTALYRGAGAATIHSLITCNETWLGNLRWCRAFPDLLLCASRQDYLTLSARNADSAAYLPLGIDLQPFRHAAGRESPRDRLKPVILYLGPLEQRKGIGTLLRAMPAILRGRPGARLVIATHGCSGRGYDAVGAQQQVLEAAGICHPQLDLREGGLDIPRLLAEVDVLAYPLATMHGTLHQPATLLEAMAAGKAVVASKLPAIEEIVTDGVDGFLAPAGDADALGERLGALLDDAALRARLGAAAAGRAAFFNIELCAKDLFHHYEAVSARDIGSLHSQPLAQA